MNKIFLKITTAVAAAILLPNIALATTQTRSDFWQNNRNLFYVAADLGMLQATFSSLYNDQTDIIPLNVQQPVMQNTYTGGLAAGYALLLHNKYSLGLELSGNFYGNNAPFQSGASSNAFSDTTKITGNVDLDFVPGVFFTDTVIGYFKVGASVAFINDSLTSPSGFTPTYSSYNQSHNQIGVATGVGIKKFICEHAAVYTEYNYHDYGSVSFPGFTNFLATYSHSAHVYTSSVNVGVAYDF